MKRTFALVALLAALGVLCKLSLKENATAKGGAGGEREGSSGVPGVAKPAPKSDPESELRARYANKDPRDLALVERTLQRYRQNAVAIERTDGLRGLALLDRLDIEAIYL